MSTISARSAACAYKTGSDEWNCQSGTAERRDHSGLAKARLIRARQIPRAPTPAHDSDRITAGRVIGSGSSLDSSRFRARLGERYGIASENVRAYVVGAGGGRLPPLQFSLDDRFVGQSMPTAVFRFYEELNDHLPVSRRKRSFTHTFDGTPAVKDAIEALGVPHTEIDLILVDGRSVRFSQRLRGGERVAVYPMFERFDIRPLYRLRPRPLRRTRFVADVHLGRLARYLRLLGFDTRYSTDLDDPTLVAISVREGRILLTRDIGLLKRRILTRGYLVRTTDAERQVEEIVRAFSLEKDLRPFTRCMSCNAAVHSVARVTVAGRVPTRVFRRFRRFMCCTGCGRLYWRGTHFQRLKQFTRRRRFAVARGA